MRSLLTSACLAILLRGCLAVAQAPATAPTAPVQAPTPDAALATHEALMADPAAHATHEAQMQTPVAMSTHEAAMHGTPTPVPVAAAAVALSSFVTDDFVGSGLGVRKLKNNAAALGVTATRPQMDATIARSAEQLGRGASLTG